MGEWKEYKFPDFVLINPSVQLAADGTYSYVEMKDLSDGHKFCQTSAERLLGGGTRFQNYDTLFARITPCLENGKICQVRGLKNRVGFGSTEFFVFRGREGVSDNDFIYYLSRWSEVRGFAEMNFHGTSGRQRVPRSCFDSLFLDLPDLPEQRAIASVLGSLDDKIDLLHRQNSTLEKMAETLFRQWFVEEANEEWDKKSLDQIANYLNGLACQKYPPENLIDRLPVVKIKDLRGGFSEASDWATSKVLDEYIVDTGDIIFSWSGSLEIVIWAYGKGVLNQHLFKVTSERYPKWFYYLATKSFLSEFRGIAEDKATTMGHIQRHHLSDAKLPVPPIEDFPKLSQTMEPLFDKIIRNLKDIRTLTQMRDTLLPKLMSGEVRVRQ